MKIGITGHQEREGIQWTWVEEVLRCEIKSIGPVEEAFTSLAIGSDQLFAKIALSLNIPVTAIIPLFDYELFFEEGKREEYKHLFAKTRKLQLAPADNPTASFLEAGKYIVDHSDLIFAVWDGEKADGVGGTGDIVEFALCRMKSIVHIDPIDKTVSKY
jgi:hypothetical protein